VEFAGGDGFRGARAGEEGVAEAVGGEGVEGGGGVADGEPAGAGDAVEAEGGGVDESRRRPRRPEQRRLGAEGGGTPPIRPAGRRRADEHGDRSAVRHWGAVPPAVLRAFAEGVGVVESGA